MQIKIHRGTHQIGGCVTEIKTDNARIIIDVGAELPRADIQESVPLNIDGVTRGNPSCDAVFVTHYHGDHVGMACEVLDGIPIYMGATAKRIYAVVQQTLKKKLGKGNSELVETFQTFEVGKPLTIKDITLTPFLIDHSAFDAYMFLIEAEGKRVLHTGDFRMHGARGNKMAAVFEKYARNVDVLITEGTMMSRVGEEVLTEHQLGCRAKQILRDNKNVFVLCSSTNIDSIAEFYAAAIVNNRVFVVCEEDFQLEILRIVSETAKSPFYNFNRRKIYVYGKNLHEFMSERGFCFLGRVNYVTEQAMVAFPDNTLIYSMWTGYLDKSRVAFDERKSAFVNKSIARGGFVEYLHTSGHADPQSIKKVCEITQAKVIVPIHSEKPENFTKLGLSGKVQILQDGDVLII